MAGWVGDRLRPQQRKPGGHREDSGGQVGDSGPHALSSRVPVTGGLPLGAWEHCPGLEMTVSEPLSSRRGTEPLSWEKGFYKKALAGPCMQQVVNKVWAVGRKGGDGGPFCCLAALQWGALF